MTEGSPKDETAEIGGFEGIFPLFAEHIGLSKESRTSVERIPGKIAQFLGYFFVRFASRRGYGSDRRTGNFSREFEVVLRDSFSYLTGLPRAKEE